MKRTHSEMQMTFPVSAKLPMAPKRKSTKRLSLKRQKATVAPAIELKFLDNVFPLTTISSATDLTGAEADPATTLCLSAPAQGDGASNREGKQIVAKSLQFKGIVFRNQQETNATPPSVGNVVVAIVIDRQTNNAQLNSEDVFSNPNGEAATIPCPLRNMSFGKRFKVLKMDTFMFDDTAMANDGAGTFGWASRSIVFDWFLPLNDLRINFNTTSTGVIGNVLDNSIHVVAFTNSSSPVISLAYNARLRFIG